MSISAERFLEQLNEYCQQNHDIFQMSDHVSTIVNWTWILED